MNIHGRNFKTLMNKSIGEGGRAPLTNMRLTKIKLKDKTILTARLKEVGIGLVEGKLLYAFRMAIAPQDAGRPDDLLAVAVRERRGNVVHEHGTVACT